MTSFRIPDKYAALEDPLIASQALRLVVATFLDSPTLPLDPLYTNLEPCERVLARYPALIAALREGNSTPTDFWTLRSHRALRRQQNGKSFAESLSRVLPAIVRVLETGGPSTWQPKSEQIPPDIRKHIASLCIPEIDGMPSVLIRDLGHFFEDHRLRVRVENIFAKGQHTQYDVNANHSFLVNTSGSGKTRLTFEGLCQNWGLYLVGAIDANSVGSSDLVDVFDHFLDRNGFRFRVLTEQETAENVVRLTRCFRKLLLCRLIVLCVFAEHIHSLGIKPEHKKLWLLLQAYPQLITDPYLSDVFSVLLMDIPDTDDDHTKDYIAHTLSKLRSVFGENFHLFIVIDEAQVTLKYYSISFQDGAGDFYPVLREIVDCLDAEFLQHEVSFVISGTELPKAGFSHSPNVALHRWCSDTGVFDDEDMHRQYVSRYLPPKYLKTSAGKAFLRLVWEWCRGRHRVTDTLMATLLRDGFQSPHLLLHDYIQRATGHRPKIGSEFLIHEKEQRERILITKLDCDILTRCQYTFSKSISEYTELKSTLQDILFQYYLTGNHPQSFSTDNIAIVTNGFGRFTDKEMAHIVVDEPVFLIALANSLFNRRPRSNDEGAEESLLDILQRSLTSSRVYPTSLIIYLSRVFATKPRVDEVFTFPRFKKPQWVKKHAEIVSLGNSLGNVQLEYAPVDSTSEVLAAIPLSVEDTIQWLSNDTLSLPPFCLPVGQFADSADLIFGLRLEDGSLKRVVVRTSVTMSNLRGDPLRKVIQDFSNDNLFKDDDPTVHDRAIAALHAIPQTTTGPRKSPVLPVLATFPGTLQLGDVKNANVAKLNNGRFEEIAKTIPASSVFDKIVESLTLQLGKRKRLIVKPAGSRKRTKHS
ncbi:hypothetical protein R3P38DRAFT_2605655 [Favolaschia claudopus]|uniref:Uncharacterized protein n=1 Tax=Favolaschia claudopus TaxID=2862362 RepID=A0AAW0D5A5_9AGAR